jgi:hypothetical protein
VELGAGSWELGAVHLPARSTAEASTVSRNGMEGAEGCGEWDPDNRFGLVCAYLVVVIVG